MYRRAGNEGIRGPLYLLIGGAVVVAIGVAVFYFGLSDIGMHITE